MPCWWNLAINRRQLFGAGFCTLAAVLTAPSAHALEPSIQFYQRSIPQHLAPQALPSNFYDFAPEEYWAEPEDSYWMTVSNWVLLQERTQGERVGQLGQWADRTLSGESHSLPMNESYLRLSFATETRAGAVLDFEPEARFRVDIPTTQKKLRLVIESESDELIPLAERQRDRQLTEPERSSNGTTGALRFLGQVGDSVNFSNDFGARLHLPPDAFWRATVRKTWQPSGDWGLLAQQRFYYYHQNGWGSRSWFEARHDLGKGWELVNSSELEWVHSDREFVAAQVFSVRKRLNNRAVLTPRVGVLGESQPGWRTTEAFADVTWRYRMYSDWLFGEIIPAMQFARDNSFKDDSSLIFRLEMYFSGNIVRRN
jgi:hypothetical protein